MRIEVKDSACGTPTRRCAPRGITVVELMVVMAIVAGLMGLGVWALGSLTSSELRSEAMRLSSVIRYTYANAAINNAQYRLVLDLDTGEYYTEVTEEPLVAEEPQSQAETDDFLTEEAQRLAEKVEEKEDLFADDEADPFGMNRKVSYQRVQDAVVEPRRLKNGVRFARVVTAHQDDPFTEGQATVTFFPNGFTEQAMIYITDESGAFYTLVTEPMTGRVRVYGEEREVPDDFGEVETDD